MTTPAEDDLPCRFLVELVTDYIEGALEPELSARVRDHLTECEGCADYVEQIRTTAGLAAGLRNDDLPPGLRAGILAAFRARSG